MIIDDGDGVTIRTPNLALISGGTVQATMQFNYKSLVESYYNNFYYGVKILGGKLIIEQLQVNYRLTSLFRSIRYLDQSPTVVQTNADKIANILNFENEYNVSTNHAVKLTIKNLDDTIRNAITFYNFGIANNQIDLITPYLTVNDVDISELSNNGGLKFELETPTGLDFATSNYFTLFGCFLFKGKIYISGVR